MSGTASPSFFSPRPMTVQSRSRRSLLLFLPLLLATGLLFARETKAAVDQELQALSPIPFPPLVPCTSDRPQLVVPVFDVSGSVIDGGGADPKARSFSEFRDVIDQLADQPCTTDDRVAALIFSGQTVEVPPTLLSSASVAKRSIVRPPTGEIGGSTNLTEALGRAQDVADRFDEFDVTIIVISDMQVDDAVTTQVGLAALQAPVHLIALGDHDTSFDQLFDSVTDVGTASRGAVGIAIVEAINKSR